VKWPLGITCIVQQALVNRSLIYGKVIALLSTQGYLCLAKHSVLSVKVMKLHGNQTKQTDLRRNRMRNEEEIAESNTLGALFLWFASWKCHQSRIITLNSFKMDFRKRLLNNCNKRPLSNGTLAKYCRQTIWSF